MKTTLDIDDDVLLAAKELAAAREVTPGKALSELARRSLPPLESSPSVRNGVPLLPPRFGERSVSMEAVNRLRDQD